MTGGGAPSARRASTSIQRPSLARSLEDLPVQVRPETGLERFTRKQLEGAAAIGLAFRPQEEGDVHVLLPKGVGQFVEMGDVENFHPGLEQGAHDLAGDLGTLA